MIILQVSDENHNKKTTSDIENIILEMFNASKISYKFDADTHEYIFLCNDELDNDNKSEIEDYLLSQKEVSKLLYTIIKNVSDLNISEQNMNNNKTELEIKKIEQMVKDAINEDRVEIYLQPIYSSKQNKFTSAEVLARIKDENGIIIYPETFIHIIEQTELIYEFEERIIKKTFEFLNQVNIKELGLNYININLSVKSGESSDLLTKYCNLINEYNIDPTLINIEITETTSISKKQQLLENMNALIKKGFTFSLDDFGSGESNLNYIIDMPISIIKFDMNMTRAFLNNEKAPIVMKSAIDMAHKLNLKTVSEGIETEEMLSYMKNLGIDYIQGYYFSKPLPINEFITFICESNKD